MSSSSNLYRLQQIDSALDRIAIRLQEIATILSGSEQLMQAEKLLSEAQLTLEQKNRTLFQSENRVRDQLYKIEQNESSLYSGRIHNPKELQDLQNEVASLKRYLVILEDQQLTAMLEVEEAEDEHNTAKQTYETIRGQVIVDNARLVVEQNTLLQDKNRLEIERQAVEQAITPESLQTYQQLRKNRRGVAVAAIQDKACSACGANLTPAVIQSASTQLVRCPSCGRFLYNK
jgi:hypothetical protein